MIQQQTEELEEFKDVIKKSKFPNAKNAFGVWESLYLKWAIAKEEESDRKVVMP
jgi:hypothetical protein